MAEQVNQRIEEMINELEQMRRTNLYDDEEIREISRRRKEFEYKVQRRIKLKEDYVQYIAYELALLEDVSLRRKQNKLGEKKKDLEYAIAKRLNKLFKQFIYRFQDDIAIYFEYMKFCKSVGFDYAVSGIIGQMLQMHGDKPKMWQLAAKWETIEQNNLDCARNFLLKGIHRHSDSDVLYLELFEVELMLAVNAQEKEDKEKFIKRAQVVWNNATKNINDITLLFRLCDLSIKYELDDTVTKEIKAEIWSKHEDKEVWCYIGKKELEGCHWHEIEEFVNEEYNFSKELNYFMAVYEEAILKFSDEKLSTKYIHGLLGVSENICSESQKIAAVKKAWIYCHENGMLTNDMYSFGIEMLKLEDLTPVDELQEILDAAAKKNPQAKCIWEEKLKLCNSDEGTLLTLQQASKAVNPSDALYLWNFVLENINSKATLEKYCQKFKKCESTIVLSIKPKLLQKMHELNGLKAARELYDELIRTPPIQIEVHNIMIQIEKSQEKANAKNIRKCYECAVQHHGMDNVQLWMDYLKFETESGNVQDAPGIYRRAIRTLKKELVDEFIKQQTMAKIK